MEAYQQLSVHKYNNKPSVSLNSRRVQSVAPPLVKVRVKEYLLSEQQDTH